MRPSEDDKNCFIKSRSIGDGELRLLRIEARRAENRSRRSRAGVRFLGRSAVSSASWVRSGVPAENECGAF